MGVVTLGRMLRALVRARPEAPTLYRSLEQVPNALFRRRVAAARGSVIDWVRDLDTAAFIVVAAAEGVP